MFGAYDFLPHRSALNYCLASCLIALNGGKKLRLFMVGVERLQSKHAGANGLAR